MVGTPGDWMEGDPEGLWPWGGGSQEVSGRKPGGREYLGGGNERAV